jgi:hypothetical protein
VQRSVDAHSSDGSALQRRQKHAPKRIANRDPKASLEGFTYEFSVAFGIRLGIQLNRFGANQRTPIEAGDL